MSGQWRAAGCRHRRLQIEAEAIVTVLNLLESGSIELLSSEVLDFEIRRTPDVKRRIRATQILSIAGRVAEVSTAVRSKAQELIQVGVKPVDALHAAVAIENHVSYFCTCDDKLLKKLKTLDLKPPPYLVSPFELVLEVTQK